MPRLIVGLIEPAPRTVPRPPVPPRSSRVTPQGHRLNTIANAHIANLEALIRGSGKTELVRRYRERYPFASLTIDTSGRDRRLPRPEDVDTTFGHFARIPLRGDAKPLLWLFENDGARSVFHDNQTAWFIRRNQLMNL